MWLGTGLQADGLWISEVVSSWATSAVPLLADDACKLAGLDLTRLRSTMKSRVAVFDLIWMFDHGDCARFLEFQRNSGLYLC